MANRITVTEYNGTTILIRQRNRFVAGTAFSAFLAFWLSSGIQANPSVPHLITTGKLTVAGGIALVSFWIAGAALVGAVVVWIFMGRSVIALSPDRLTLAEQFGTLLQFHERTFATSKISWLRVEARQRKARGRAYTVFLLVFDYDGRTIEFAPSLTQEEGYSLANGPLKSLTGDGQVALPN